MLQEIEPKELTVYQRAVIVGLTYGTPGVAKMYERICREPGKSMSTYSLGYGHGAERVIRLERLGVIFTRKNPDSGYRRCYPTPDPAWAK